MTSSVLTCFGPRRESEPIVVVDELGEDGVVGIVLLLTRSFIFFDKSVLLVAAAYDRGV